MFCERKFSDILHMIGMKLDTLNCQDVEMCISYFFYVNRQIFPRVMALNDLKIDFNIGYMFCSANSLTSYIRLE